jgi:hypothetical protein
MIKRREVFCVDSLEIENLISQCMACDDQAGAQALAELCARHDIPLDRKWINDHIKRTKGLWSLRREKNGNTYFQGS